MNHINRSIRMTEHIQHQCIKKATRDKLRSFRNEKGNKSVNNSTDDNHIRSKLELNKGRINLQRFKKTTNNKGTPIYANDILFKFHIDADHMIVQRERQTLRRF